MKCAIVFLVLGAVTASPQLRWSRDEQVKDVSDKQIKVNELFTGLGSEDIFDHTTKDFPFTDAKYYKNARSLEKFLAAWHDGFITKDAVFSLYSYKNRHHTYRLFDIFYFAKDFETFIKIAQWARSELHPLQFAYAFTAALFHRKDASGLAIPHFFETLPHYFVPYDFMQGAYKAHILGIKSRKFDLNSTGYEYSWYKEQGLGVSPEPKWNQYDTETRLSYFTEDFGLSEFLSKASIAFAPWISDEKYPDIQFYRKGEVLFSIYKTILKKYNLERYANNLPPVEPINFKMPIKTGYNPHTVCYNGHQFTARPDSLVPFHSNTEGVNSLYLLKKRYDEVTDLLGYINPINSSLVHFEDDFNGLSLLGELIYGSTHPHVRSMYRPYHYHAFEVLDNAVRSTNDIGNGVSVLGNYLTEMRDPAYYRVLATVYQVFSSYFNKLPPYTPKEIGFPGVKIVHFETSKLETYFENHDYDITNGVPMKGGKFEDYHYVVSKTRLNHKPFTYKFTINSDKDQDAVIRIYLTPGLDSNNRELSIAEKVDQAVSMFFYHLKLKKGENVFNGDCTQGLYSSMSDNNMKTMIARLNKGKSSEPFFAPTVTRCSAPLNLLLPRGHVDGKPYSIFAIVSPYNPSGESKNGPCNWDVLTGTDKPIYFPTNRRVVSSYFRDLDNVYFKDVNIYHTEKH